MNIRKLSEKEKSLIIRLVRNYNKKEKIISMLDTYLVEDMDDGGMGSIQFVQGSNRKYDFELGPDEYVDIDKIPIMVTLFMNNLGDPYALDIWKVDYSKVKEIIF